MLSSPAKNALVWMEQAFMLNGELPTLAKTQEKFPALTESQWTGWFKDAEFREALLQRGIALRDFDTVRGNGVLTEHQLVVANTLLDFADRRSQSKKLADLNCPTATYQSWLKDPAFQEYVRNRAENSLGDNLHGVHGGLLDAAMRGDTSAIKLYYELTGRFVQGSSGAVDVSLILLKILEVIQRYVQDPAVITAIADELGTFSVQSAPQSRPKELLL